MAITNTTASPRRAARLGVLLGGLAGAALAVCLDWLPPGAFSFGGGYRNGPGSPAVLQVLVFGRSVYEREAARFADFRVDRLAWWAARAGVLGLGGAAAGVAVVSFARAATGRGWHAEWLPALAALACGPALGAAYAGSCALAWAGDERAEMLLAGFLAVGGYTGMAAALALGWGRRSS